MKNCAYCGKEFGEGLRASFLAARRFCSKSCAATMNQANRDGRKTCQCKWCGKTFETFKSRPGSYCSRECNGKGVGHGGKGRSRPWQRRPENFVTLVCEECGTDYVVHKSQTEGRVSRYCSRKCAGKGRGLLMTGIGHPQWKGGVTDFPDRGVNWYTQRRLAFARDGGKCAICGTSKKKIKGKIIRIDVHHIKPYRLFEGDYIAANDLSNLITLCRKCHCAVEDRGLPCPVPLFKD